MSQTFEICCTQCKLSLWVGQDRHIFTSAEKVEHLGIFLHSHVGHPLVFCDSGSLIACECEELSEPVDLGAQ